MSDHNQDRDKVIGALGGKKGLIDSGLPAVVFLVIFNVKNDLKMALTGAIILSILLAIIRLIKKDTVQHAISGLIGVLLCAYFANKSGNASDFYIPKLLTNLAYGSAYLIANLIGWPLLGVVLGPLLGEKIQPESGYISVLVGFGLLCSFCVSQCSIQFISQEMSIYWERSI